MGGLSLNTSTMSNFLQIRHSDDRREEESSPKGASLDSSGASLPQNDVM